MTRKTINSNIVLLVSMVKQIDIARGDVSRSRFAHTGKYLNDKKESENKTN